MRLRTQMFTPAFRSFRPSSLLKNERLISGLAFRRAVNEVFSATLQTLSVRMAKSMIFDRLAVISKRSCGIKPGVTLRKKKGLRVSCCQSVKQPTTEVHPPKALHLPVSVVQLPQCFMAA